jgi:hypothetical protein
LEPQEQKDDIIVEEEDAAASDEEKKQQIQSSGTRPLRVDIKIAAICLSVVSSSSIGGGTRIERPKELLVLSVVGLDALLMDTYKATTLELYLQSFQVDNMEPIPSYPMVLGRSLVCFVFLYCFYIYIYIFLLLLLRMKI